MQSITKEFEGKKNAAEKQGAGGRHNSSSQNSLALAGAA